MKQNLDWSAPVKSSENSGSGNKNNIGDSKSIVAAGNFTVEKGDETVTLETHREIIELSNRSVLHGYDMAIELLGIAQEESAVKSLIESRSIIEGGLKNIGDEKIKGSK